jgi:hypothetical protein
MERFSAQPKRLHLGTAACTLSLRFERGRRSYSESRETGEVASRDGHLTARTRGHAHNKQDSADTPASATVESFIGMRQPPLGHGAPIGNISRPAWSRNSRH